MYCFVLTEIRRKCEAYRNETLVGNGGALRNGMPISKVGALRHDTFDGKNGAIRHDILLLAKLLFVKLILFVNELDLCDVYHI